MSGYFTVTPQTDISDRLVVVGTNGQLDGALKGSEIREQFKKLLLAQEGKNILIDMSGVLYIDSANMAAILVAMEQAMKTGTEVSMYSLTPDVDQLVEMTGMKRISSIYKDYDAAISHYTETVH